MYNVYSNIIYFRIKTIARQISKPEYMYISQSLYMYITESTLLVFYVRRLNPFKSLPLGSYISVPSLRTISVGDVQVDLRVRKERNLDRNIL